jgi:transcriptional regulator with XRE-family HTH domain
MTITELKKELGLTQKEIAQFFNMTYGAYANSSAKKRYEDALCNFYAFVKGKREGEKNNKITPTDLD